MHTERGIPLAGRLKHFLRNWQVITQDKWVLEAVQGCSDRIIHWGATLAKTVRTDSSVAGREQSVWQQMRFREYSRKDRHPEPCPGGGVSSPMYFWSSTKAEVRDLRWTQTKRIICSDRTFQGPAGSRGLHVEGRPKGRLLHGTQRTEDFLKFTDRDVTYKLNSLLFGLAGAPWVFTKVVTPLDKWGSD